MGISTVTPRKLTLVRVESLASGAIADATPKPEAVEALEQYLDGAAGLEKGQNMLYDEALKLVQQWTEEEMEYLFYKDKAKADQAAEAYSMVLQKPYIVNEFTIDAKDKEQRWCITAYTGGST